MAKTWRDEAARVIDSTLADLLSWNPSATMNEKREALKAAYPFGERKYWPYKVWLSECKRRLKIVRDKPLELFPDRQEAVR